jgi:5-(carboxyamino)imidazole ribonucleotide synthase
MSLKVTTVGIIGGGQLGMFLAHSCNKLGLTVFVYSDSKRVPAEKYADKMFYGSFEDVESLKIFSSEVDLITYEFENVSTKALNKLKGTKIYPPISALTISQDRKKEKQFFSKNKINHAGIGLLNSKNSLKRLKTSIQYPVILKTTRFGYDGKGQALVKNTKNLERQWKENGYQDCIIERKINLKKEVSVICARDIKRNSYFYPTFTNVHKNHILFETKSPSSIDAEIEGKLIKISKKIITKLNYIGLLTIEFFIDKENTIYVNEIAPRVHNSGHITLDNANISQFELHIKAITGKKILKPKLLKKGLMRNLIGNEIKRVKSIKSMRKYKGFKKNVKYDYGKKIVKGGRKMGHINFIS